MNFCDRKGKVEEKLFIGDVIIFEHHKKKNEKNEIRLAKIWEVDHDHKSGMALVRINIIDCPDKSYAIFSNQLIAIIGRI